MNEHPADELLLQHYDGTLTSGDEARVARHVAHCGPCRGRLDELGGLDQFVVRHAPGDALLDAAMFAASEQALTQAAQPRRRVGWRVLLLAASLCIGAGAWWWQTAQDTWSVRIRLHVPGDPLRSAPTTRFHLDLDVPAPVFVTALVRLRDGTVDELVPGAGQPEAVVGAVRLPPHELLDWEYGADRAPIELLVATSRSAPSPDDRRVLREQWHTAPAGRLPPRLPAAAADARLLPFPTPSTAK